MPSATKRKPTKPSPRAAKKTKPHQAKKKRKAATARANGGGTANGKAVRGATPGKPSAELRALHKAAATLASVNQLLNWDQETYMPPEAAAHRADQQAMLSALVHERRTSKRMGDLLSAAEEERGLNDEERANLREMRRDFERETKLPTTLVAELAKVQSQSQEVWKEARSKNNFAMFAPWLQRVMELLRQKARCYGVPKGGELYDALLDEYEPGMTAREIEGIFTPLRGRLAGLVARIAATGRGPDRSVLGLKFSQAQHTGFVAAVLEAMRFDSKAGRLDVTTHPFCSGLAPGDTRLTFRWQTESFLEPLYGVMHEAGHGLYEQGLPKATRFGEPLGDAVSLGIHESQSRMWENFVGRSRSFWTWALPIAKRHYAPALDGHTIEKMFEIANLVRPSFIRVEADEATYNLHIMLRFEIERALIKGDLAVSDLPEAWNSAFKAYLGLDVPDDRRGCLQDVHWAFGLVGYFPTYTLGNLYAAQFWEKINSRVTDLDAQMARGQFGALKHWLNENIHAHGRRYSASELCMRTTGKPLSAEPLMRHLEGKLAPIYGL
ncbi:MAG: carboxypeptidase M32 [Phycisphaerales bacterium]